MPVYKVKPEKNYGPVATDSAEPNKKTYPSVCIPVSPEIIAALEVGAPVTVTLQGIVQGLESRQSTGNDPWANRNELRVELRVVEADPGEEQADDDGDEPEETMESAISKGLGYEKAEKE